MQKEYLGNLDRKVLKLFKMYLSPLSDPAYVLMYGTSSLGAQVPKVLQ